MKFFITGASGYIGGTLSSLLAARGHEVRGLVRDAGKIAAVECTGVVPVLGNLSETALLAEEGRAADVVINAADSDHRPALEAMLSALEGTGKPLIHTSGSSVVSDTADGEASDSVYTEDDPVASTEQKQVRLEIDNMVRAASTRQIRTIVICNTMIYGHGLGAHRDSIQVPSLINQAKRSGIPRHVGRGLNRWSTIHVKDMAELYIAAIERAPAGLFVFAESGEVQFRDITSAIARRYGLPETRDWTIEDAIAEWGYEYAVFALGSNSRVRSRYARQVLGWAPKEAGVLDWIEREAD
ncbi:NAD-dependent epimerase/dehydratase family protein [Inquilinus sp. OTU3971]|uniref:NAD-dependent epimerase/dehydratase family protein n=1 Tax=Inquilinus sp. OTU3971 TaxID=3043855 RepID=UPI00313D4C52